MKGSKLPYHLRVNKHVDRQLFLEAMAHVGRYQSVADMAYISMGGGYLEDFRVMHQTFDIRKMLSFDMEGWMTTRQLKNRPYGFVKCIRASSTEIVRDFDGIRRTYASDGRTIVWLDYTEWDQRHDQLSDLAELTSKLIHGDVFRITMNAHRANFGKKEVFELTRVSGETKKENIFEWWNELLVEQIKDFMPPERNDPNNMESDLAFAETLVGAVKIAVDQGLASRPSLIAEPLMSVAYADGQQMITVSAFILDKSKRAEFLDRSKWSEWPHCPKGEWGNVIHLAVPHMSISERRDIHQKLVNPPEAIAVEFKLDENDDEHRRLIEQYVLHHRRYPTLGSVNLM